MKKRVGLLIASIILLFLCGVFYHERLNFFNNLRILNLTGDQIKFKSINKNTNIKIQNYNLKNKKSKITQDVKYDNLSILTKKQIGYNTKLNEFNKKQIVDNTKLNEFNKKQIVDNTKLNEFNKKQIGYNTKLNEFNEKQIGYNTKLNEFNEKQIISNKEKQKKINKNVHFLSKIHVLKNGQKNMNEIMERNMIQPRKTTIFKGNLTIDQMIKILEQQHLEEIKNINNKKVEKNNKVSDDTNNSKKTNYEKNSTEVKKSNSNNEKVITKQKDEKSHINNKN